MIVVKPSYKNLTGINPIKHLQLIKKIGRVCYKSKENEKADRACICLLFADSTPLETLAIFIYFRKWRNIFELWCAKDPYSHLRQLLIPLLKKLKNSISLIFNNIEYMRI